MSYLDKLKPIQIQNPQAGSGAIGGGYRQKLKPIEPSAPIETKESRIAKGLPVGMGDRATPTAAGNIIRDVAKPFAKLSSSINALEQVTKGVPMSGVKPERSNYFGDVKRIGSGFDVTKGVTPENLKAVRDAAGTGVELSSFIPVGTGLKVMANIARQPFKQGVMQSAKTLGREGFTQGALSAGGRSIQEGDNVGQISGKSLVGGGIGAVTGGIIGAGTSAITRAFSKTPANFIDQKIDKNIRNALAGVTGDLDTLETSAVKAKNALQRLILDTNIEIPDISKPLGSGAKKPFNINKTTPNEFISAINKQSEKIAEIGKSSAEEASKSGRTIDTIEAQRIVAEAVNSGMLPRATGERFMRQIQSLKNDPLNVHEWVQGVNKNWKQDMTKSPMTKQIAENIAKTFRQELDRNVYRTEYGQAFGDNQELKRLLIAVAKKANKKADFGDITSDAGLDAAISILTGNPLFMARTLADSVFKNVVRGIRNQSGFKGMVKAGKLSQGVDGAKMPTKGVRPQLALPAGKIGAPRIQMQSGKAIPVSPKGATIETTSSVPMAGIYNPTTQPKANPKVLNNKIRDVFENEFYTDPNILPSISMGAKPSKLRVKGDVVDVETSPNVYALDKIKDTVEKYIPDDQLPVIQMGKSKNLSKKPNLQSGKISGNPLNIIGGATLGATGLVNIPRKAGTYQAPPQQTEFKSPKIDYKKLPEALMMLESSGGTNKKNADPGELKWLTGLTEVAIKELKRLGRLPKNFNKNNKQSVLDASVEYFKLMQEKNPEMTPEEVYVEKYWTQGKTPEEKIKKMVEFNQLTK